MSGARVCDFRSGLERIVVADVDGLALDIPAMDFEHLVLQDGRVIVKRPLENRPLGDLDEFRRDLDAVARRPSSESEPGRAQAAAIRPTANRRLATTVRLVRKPISFSPPLPMDVN